VLSWQRKDRIADMDTRAYFSAELKIKKNKEKRKKEKEK
jgi:hypothetical protein